jgi:hypothetical protein
MGRVGQMTIAQFFGLVIVAAGIVAVLLLLVAG